MSDDWFIETIKKCTAIFLVWFITFFSSGLAIFLILKLIMHFL